MNVEKELALGEAVLKLVYAFHLSPEQVDSSWVKDFPKSGIRRYYFKRTDGSILQVRVDFEDVDQHTGISQINFLPNSMGS